MMAFTPRPADDSAEPWCCARRAPRALRLNVYESLPLDHPVHAAGRRVAPAVREQAERERHPLDREHRRVHRLRDLRAALVLGTTRQNADFQFVERAPWIPSIGADYFLGVDGFSMLLILLTTMMGSIAVLSSWTAITERVKEYYIFLLRAADRDARRVHVARLPAVLPVLGSDAGADVLPHRHLGQRQPAVLGDQVLPLHAGRQRRDAARHPGALLLQLHVRPASTPSTSRSSTS